MRGFWKKSTVVIILEAFINTGKTEYVCRAIRLDDTVELYRVELSDCQGYAKDEKISLISFRKDAL